MKVTIDKAGRIVLPKPLRDELGIVADEQFDVLIEGSAIRLERAEPPKRTLDQADGWPVIRAAGASPRTTDADIRALRDADQR